jgi:hypothetical protein
MQRRGGHPCQVPVRLPDVHRTSDGYLGRAIRRDMGHVGGGEASWYIGWTNSGHSLGGTFPATGGFGGEASAADERATGRRRAESLLDASRPVAADPAADLSS